MATYSSILAWRIPWTEEPGGLQSVGSPRVGHDWAHTATTTTRICLGFFLRMMGFQGQMLGWGAEWLQGWWQNQILKRPLVAELQRTRVEVGIEYLFIHEVKWKSLSCVQLFATPWTTQSTKFSRPEYWSGQPFPSPEDLPNPGIKPRWVDSLPVELWGKPRKTKV